MTDLKEQKDNYREHARAHRERLDVDETDFETVITVFLDEFKPSKDQIIAAYWPVKKEFDCRFLLDELVKQGFTCALPVATKDSRVMTFKQWTHETQMQNGAWNVPEPKDGETLDPDIILAPLLAFDQKGYRLGYGGGHYDNTVANLRTRKEIFYVGVGFAEQAVLLKLPREEHDIPLDYMLTPQGVTDFKDGRD